MVIAGTEITPETAAGNDPSSLGAPPPVTPVGPDTPVPGLPSLVTTLARAAVPATAADNATLPGPDGLVPGVNGTNSSGNVSTAGR